MIAYALIIVDGCLHARFMTVMMGGREIKLNCEEVKRFIRQANNEGINEALENIRPNTSEGQAVMTMMYEKFKEESWT